MASFLSPPPLLNRERGEGLFEDARHSAGPGNDPSINQTAVTMARKKEIVGAMVYFQSELAIPLERAQRRFLPRVSPQ